MAIVSNFDFTAQLNDCELLECADLIDFLPIETMDLFGELTSGFGRREGCVQGKVCYLRSQ